MAESPATAAKPGTVQLSVAAHPRAVQRIAQARELAGLLGFLLGGYLALPTNTLAGAGLRALVAGVGCYVIVWGAAVLLWRHFVVAELRSHEHQLMRAELAKLDVSPHPERPPRA